ncbi:apolipoprotein D-like [Acanthaster planci]|uniref:Apolipoprotein D n=1 Tax=Acanthaster planci TaxID=133434 RepID=A0A8B7Y5F0_ACAPL|nr:apolipoprotein D-like [Acanthaster planci]
MKGFTVSVGLILAGLVACCHAQVFSWGPCPAVQVKQDFNATRYFGKWYEILRFNKTSFEEGTRCNYAIYSNGTRNGTLSVRNAGLRGSEVDSVEGFAYAPDPSQPGKLKVRFSKSWFAGNYWVLDTDYRTFSMVHSCTGFWLFNFQLNWLLSPSRSITADVTTNVMEKFQDAGVDTSNFIQTNQTRCPDF